MKIFSPSNLIILFLEVQTFPQLLFRLVELDKLRLNTRKEEAKDLAAKGGVDPSIIIMPPSASKGGVSEKLIKVGRK